MLAKYRGKMPVFHMRRISGNRCYTIRVAFGIDSFHIIMGKDDVLCYLVILKLP